jgi:hypothetical protein
MGPPRDVRAKVTAPTLVIGVPIDPFHPMSDAVAVTEELPDARLIRTASLADLRVRPERLAGEIARFIGDCRRRAAAAADPAAADPAAGEPSDPATEIRSTR